MNEERLKVLEMVGEGKLTAEQGAELLKAMVPTKEERKIVKLEAKAAAAKLIKIKVQAEGTNIDVKLPLGIAKAALAVAGPQIESALEDQDIDLDLAAILQFIEEDFVGEIVDITTDNGEIIKIVIE